MSSLNPTDQYFESQKEPAAGCLQALRLFLLTFNPHIREAWKYRMPFYYYKGKMFCYLWTRKDSGQPYLGIANGIALQHPDLIIEERKRMKILLIDPKEDLPIEKIKLILTMAIDATI